MYLFFERSAHTLEELQKEKAIIKNEIAITTDLNEELALYETLALVEHAYSSAFKEHCRVFDENFRKIVNDF